MSWGDKEEKPKVVLKALLKLGLSVEHAKKHDVAVCPETNAKTTIPRHVPLDKYTVGSICDFLIANGYAKKDIIRALKW